MGSIGPPDTHQWPTRYTSVEPPIHICGPPIHISGPADAHQWHSRCTSVAHRFTSVTHPIHISGQADAHQWPIRYTSSVHTGCSIYSCPEVLLPEVLLSLSAASTKCCRLEVLLPEVSPSRSVENLSDVAAMFALCLMDVIRRIRAVLDSLYWVSMVLTGVY